MESFTPVKDGHGRGEDEERSALMRQGSEALTMSIQFGVVMALAALGGRWLDHRTGGENRWTVVCVVFGFLFCGYEVWKWYRRATWAADHPERKPEEKASGPDKRE